MRFSSSSANHSRNPFFFAFNSLYEIQRSQKEIQKISTRTSFNSLYEIRYYILAFNSIVKVENFQFSLWDSLKLLTFLATKNTVFQFSLWDSAKKLSENRVVYNILSILFMRFSEISAWWSLSITSLSILFMRFMGKKGARP